MEKNNKWHLEYNPTILPTIAVYDDKGNILADVVRSYNEFSDEFPKILKQNRNLGFVSTLGVTNCGEGEGDFYEAFIHKTGEEERFCSLEESLDWINKKTKKRI